MYNFVITIVGAISDSEVARAMESWFQAGVKSGFDGKASFQCSGKTATISVSTEERGSWTEHWKMVANILSMTDSIRMVKIVSC